ncbi:HAMP domain-containing protein [Hydrogenivirga caldilitoris]|uniref:HAMP domain-containing protein n=1 Tax=Hydrogenivirga caldilitoris TaxID=246264 RepID=A0A497XQN8_9AQUI|nr:HAMP domain-containing protein [Hydrogenivirga caldilitoris]RLJ71275.1 HAMP domain-containing protein [Hydrogenivirga caldilitoris]
MSGKSVIKKIMSIVILGSVMGAAFVGMLTYFALVQGGVKDDLALRYSVGLAVFMELLWLVGPILGIKLMIEKLILSKINHITELMDKVSTGEVDVSVEVKGNDEIAQLAEAFEKIRLSIKALYEMVE